MQLNQLFKTHWQQKFAPLLPPGASVLVAVSGGVDSIVLAHLLRTIDMPIIMAHVNFQLRGEESNRDEAFVQSFAQQIGVALLVKKVDTNRYAIEKKLSIQEAAREIRYDWFNEIISYTIHRPPSTVLLQPFMVAVAHHANDSIETSMMHFFRGTGIEGLKGIPSIHHEKKIIRPLLPFTREQIEEYANQEGLGYVTDSSNLNNDYTRNYFRNVLIPQLKEVFPQVQENLYNNTQRFRETGVLYRQAVNMHLKKMLEPKGTEWHIPILKWKKAEPLHTLSYEIIAPFGFTAAQTTEVIKLLDAANGSSIKSFTHQIIKNRLWMIIAPLQTTNAATILVENIGTTMFDGGELALKLVQQIEAATLMNFTEYVDATKIQFPLILRKYKVGDYFYPLGMTKKKKIAKFLIDQKLSKTEKEKVWVLEMDKKIIAVLGYRIDNRFKYTTKDQPLLQIIHRR